MLKSVDVTYAGIDFTVIGSYATYKPATMYQKNGDPGEPAEGGNFEDYSVYLGDNDLTDLLSDDVLQYIMELADEAASEADEGPDAMDILKDLDRER
jgi:hypothetical protein